MGLGSLDLRHALAWRATPRRCGIAALAILCCLGSAAPAWAQTGQKAQFGLSDAPGGPVTGIARRFADAAKKSSDGALEIDLFPAGQLGGEAEMLMRLQSGTLAIAALSSVLLAQRDPAFELDQIPFLATDYSDAALLDRLSRPVLGERAARLDLEILYVVRLPPVGLLRAGSPPAIASLDAMKGVKVRPNGALQARLALQIGAVPVQMAFAELPQALQVGLIDAAFLSPSSVAVLKVERATFEDLRLLYPKIYTVAARRWTEGLDAPRRAAVQRAVAEASEAVRPLIREFDAG